MSKRLDLLSARNLILAAAGVLVLSVLGMCLSMLRPHDSGGVAGDSFGTRGRGYRGLFELMDSLGVPVSRNLAQPEFEPNKRVTQVMINPHPGLVASAPKYVHALGTWVDGGGRVVLTPSTGRDFRPPTMFSPADEEQVDILEALGIDGAVELGEKSADYVERDYTSETGGETAEADDKSDSADLPRGPWGVRHELPPPDHLAVTGEGSLATLAKKVRQLAVPSEGFSTLTAKDDVAGSLSLTGKDGTQKMLVAIVRRGAGEIVVVAEPALVSNRLLAESDNSVLAAYLLAPRREPVVFDEFYHGLAVRGNPLYLLTRAGFAATTLGLLLVVGVFGWRAAVFLGPPLKTRPRSRRDIGEYISAMSQFFSRGRGSRRFIISEIRDGVLRQICQELKLPLDTMDIDSITNALARRDRQRAQRLNNAIREVDATLAQNADFPKETFLSVMQRLASCL